MLWIWENSISRCSIDEQKIVSLQITNEIEILRINFCFRVNPLFSVLNLKEKKIFEVNDILEIAKGS